METLLVGSVPAASNNRKNKQGNRLSISVSRLGNLIQLVIGVLHSFLLRSLFTKNYQSVKLTDSIAGESCQSDVQRKFSSSPLN